MTTSSTPDLLRVLARSVVACVLTELVIGLGLTAARWELSLEAWAALVGWGLGAGAALAVAEAALLRFGVLPALAAGAALSPLALLGATFEVHLVSTRSSEVAAQRVFGWFEVYGPTEWSGLALGALFVHGAFVVALYRPASPPGQALAMAAGAGLWSMVVAVIGPWELPSSWQVLPLSLLAPALVVPPGRRLADRLLRLVRRRAAAPRARPARTWLRRAQALTLALLAALVLVAVRHGSSRPLHREYAGWRVLLDGDAGDLYDCGRTFGDPIWSALPCLITTVDRESERPRLPVVRSRQVQLEWYELAAARGDLRAMRALHRLDWLAQAATAGDGEATLELADTFLLSRRQLLTPLGPPLPGAHPAWQVDLSRVGLDALRRAHAVGAAGATMRLVNALRLAPSATSQEARARLEEAIALCEAHYTRNDARIDVPALQRACAALDEGRAR